MTEHGSQVSRVRSITRTVTVFYLLVAFEFFYMATPFAVYFYSIYGPGLTFLNGIPNLAWLSDSFLPHVVMETSSRTLNVIRVLGPIFAVLGAALFLGAAIPVYYAKLKRSGPVTGGLYRYIRHPQYAGLIIWGLGLVILWPRTIALLLFIAMLFVYFFLARVEEQECERRFGARYAVYRDATGMFLPFRTIRAFPRLPRTPLKRIAMILTLYCIAAGAALVVAAHLKQWSLESLYAYTTENAVFVSATAMSDDSLARLAAGALASPEVQSRLALAPNNAQFVNYVIPDDIYLIEVPMRRRGTSHGFIGSTHGDSDHRLLKLIITEAAGVEGRRGIAMLADVTGRTPLLEVRIEPTHARVLEVFPLSGDSTQRGIPFPAF